MRQAKAGGKQKIDQGNNSGGESAKDWLMHQTGCCQVLPSPTNPPHTHQPSFPMLHLLPHRFLPYVAGTASASRLLMGNPTAVFVAYQSKVHTRLHPMAGWIL
ncbi:hypothetical protein CLOM_g16729 [Closterium sp. NIES-68]|nr:hypothetical protein CLOM_g16729 [Closterium sp. NIES-68]GJP70605.1 hypothetical protein CLOP_g1524 [Closterium sp. NIES-67]